MNIISGQSACGGIAFGKLAIKQKNTSLIKRRHIKNAEEEIKRFDTARAETDKQLGILYNKALSEVGEENAMIFEIHKMMLEDEDYLNSIHNIIKSQMLNAEAAVAATADNFAEMFTAMDDSYMQARASDVRDVSERIISVLAGNNNLNGKLTTPVIIAADDLVPSETVQLDKEKILAFVTENGSRNSHTSILARTLNIPAITQANGITNPDFGGADVIVDGFNGKVYINPDEKTRSQMLKLKEEADKHIKLLNTYKEKEPVTKDGKNIKLYANIGNTDDLALVYKNGAQGVGLFRSEFVYLERKNFPTEDEQFRIYKSVVEKMAGKTVIIRTLDIGADKQVDYFNMPHEENPAMGIRAIRICLKNPKIFKTQLRALYRASVYGNMSIMFPMITSLDEVIEIKKICTDVQNELKAEKIPYSENVELGIMIETPAAALICDKLAGLVSFFSVGTNDLTQYTMAADRQNSEAEKYCTGHHTAILRMIKYIADCAHKCGIWAGICGELGSNIDLIPFFLAAGIDELSVSPGKILEVKKAIIETDVSKIKNEQLKRIE